MSQSEKMRVALSEVVIPRLSENGFTGTYPHYKRKYHDRIELLSFQTNKYGNSFLVEISTVFLSERKRDSNLSCDDSEDPENANVWDTNIRYRVKGMYDGWFYYTDLYRQKTGSIVTYHAIGEAKANDYIPAKNETLVQKANNDIYRKVCEEVMLQMKYAFQWWEAFNRNNRLKMKLLEKKSEFQMNRLM